MHKKNGLWETVIQGEKFLNDRRSDVIRQIARDHRGSPLRQICREHIGSMNVQLRLGSKLFLKVRCQTVIELNSVEFVRARQEMARESAAAGSDFNNARRVITAGGNRKPFQNRIANEKVLPELARQASSVKQRLNPLVSF